ncbi:MAG: chorismate mutase, partial [Desulfobacterales bacterium]
MGFCKEASGKDMQRESKKIGADQATTRRLDKRRRSIDEIDATLLDLINKRLSQAKEIGKIKEDHRAPIRDNVRESEILERLLALNEGCLLSKTSLLQIFSDIVAASRDIQKPSVSNTRGKEVPSVY